MKIKFTLIISIIFILFSCNPQPSKEKLLVLIKEEALYFTKPIIISSSHNHSEKSNSEKSTEIFTVLEYTIPIKKLTIDNIEIFKDQIALTLPAPELTNNIAVKEGPLKEILSLYENKVELLKNELQIFTTERLGNLFKAHGYNKIKIKYTYAK